MNLTQQLRRLGGTHPMMQWYALHKSLTGRTDLETALGSWAAMATLVAPPVRGFKAPAVLLLGETASHPLIDLILEWLEHKPQRTVRQPRGRAAAPRETWYLPDVTSLYGRGHRGTRDYVMEQLGTGSALVGHLDPARWRRWVAGRHVRAGDLAARSAFFHCNPVLVPLGVDLRESPHFQYAVPALHDFRAREPLLPLYRAGCSDVDERWMGKMAKRLPPGLAEGMRASALHLAHLISISQGHADSSFRVEPWQLELGYSILGRTHFKHALELSSRAQDTDHLRSVHELLQWMSSQKDRIWFAEGEMAMFLGISIQDLRRVTDTLFSSGHLDRNTQRARDGGHYWRQTRGEPMNGDQALAVALQHQLHNPTREYAKGSVAPRAVRVATLPETPEA